MIIRTEKESDYSEIYSLVKTAFETAAVSDGDEQDFVFQLRASQNYLPELALVADDCGRLAGHIMLTKTFIKTQGCQTEALLLSPLAVLKEYRNKGIGTSLVFDALARARQAGYNAVFLCGDPDYYGRFGFTTVANFQISYTMDIPSKFVLACELEKDALKGVEGSISIV